MASGAPIEGDVPPTDMMNPPEDASTGDVGPEPVEPDIEEPLDIEEPQEDAEVAEATLSMAASEVRMRTFKTSKEKMGLSLVGSFSRPTVEIHGSESTA